MQIFLQLAEHFGRTFSNPLGYKVGISETHHESKLDSPSGTAKTLQQVLSGTDVETEITSHRTGDAHGTHEIQAVGPDDKIVLLHEAFSRKGFADGAVRGAEWLAERTGVYDYRDIYSQL
jgi:4-hydroxy-tetrahydrodipicolinate reductase